MILALPLLSTLLPVASALRGRVDTDVLEKLVVTPRDDWPDRRGSLTNEWGFQVRMQRNPCAVGETDITCEGELVATYSSPGVKLVSGPSYVVRAVGQTIEVCNTTAATSQTERAGSAFVTRFTCRVRAGGAYELRALLTYENQEDAYIAPPRCSVPCICSDLKLPSRGFPSFVAPRALLAPTGRVGGRWTRQADGKWAFYADDHPGSTAAVDLSSSIPDPAFCPMFYMVGDSHMRKALKFMAARGFRVRYVNAAGLQNHYIQPRFYDKAMDDMEHGNCTYQIFDGGYGKHSVTRAANVGKWTRLKLGEGDVVILGSGTWDLRDMSVKDFMKDFEVFSGRLAAVAKVFNKSRFVYRTAPAFPYWKKDLGGRQMLTNERLIEANARVREKLKSLPPNVAHWDSLSTTLPRFEESCDDLHFICNHDELEKSRIGIADLSLFLSSVCGMEKTAEVDYVAGIRDGDDGEDFLRGMLSATGDDDFLED